MSNKDQYSGGGSIMRRKLRRRMDKCCVVVKLLLCRSTKGKSNLCLRDCRKCNNYTPELCALPLTTIDGPGDLHPEKASRSVPGKITNKCVAYVKGIMCY